MKTSSIHENPKQASLAVKSTLKAGKRVGERPIIEYATPDGSAAPNDS